MYCGLTSMPESVRRVVSSAIARIVPAGLVAPPARTAAWSDASTSSPSAVAGLVLLAACGSSGELDVRRRAHVDDVDDRAGGPCRRGRSAHRGGGRHPAGRPAGLDGDGAAGGERQRDQGARPRHPRVRDVRRRIHDGRVRARSKKFSKGGTTVDGDVDVYATAAELQAQLELYRDPAIVDCLQNLFTKALQSTRRPARRSRACR